PRISAQIVAHAGLDELARSTTLPIHPAPGLNAIEATASVAATDHSMEIQNALLRLGRTRVTASGDLRKGAEIQAELVMNELATLLTIGEHPSGTIHLDGSALIPANGPLVLTGNLSSHDLAYNQFRDVRLQSGFRVDPKTIAVTGLTVHLL